MITPRARTVDIVRQVAADHNVPLASVLNTGCRRRPVMLARREAIKAIASARPHYSSTQIAAVFRADHTSILYALGRLSTRKPNDHAYARVAFNDQAVAPHDMETV